MRAISSCENSVLIPQLRQSVRQFKRFQVGPLPVSDDLIHEDLLAGKHGQREHPAAACSPTGCHGSSECAPTTAKDTAQAVKMVCARACSFQVCCVVARSVYVSLRPLQLGVQPVRAGVRFPSNEEDARKPSRWGTRLSPRSRRKQRSPYDADHRQGKLKQPRISRRRGGAP